MYKNDTLFSTSYQGGGGCHNNAKVGKHGNQKGFRASTKCEIQKTERIRQKKYKNLIRLTGLSFNQ
jgi:hypothetical protein